MNQLVIYNRGGEVDFEITKKQTELVVKARIWTQVLLKCGVLHKRKLAINPSEGYNFKVVFLSVIYF